MITTKPCNKLTILSRLRRIYPDFPYWGTPGPSLAKPAGQQAIWESLPAYASAHAGRRLIAIETCGETVHSEVTYEHGDSLVFGSETKGLSDDILALFEQSNIVRLPMLPGSRSLNLSNAVAVAIFEAWRQLDFVGRH